MISGIKQQARLNMKGKTPNVFLVAAVYIVIITVLSELRSWLPGFNQGLQALGELRSARELQALLSGDGRPVVEFLMSYFRPFGAFLAFIIAILLPIVSFGFSKYCLKTTRSGGGDLKTLFEGFNQFGKVFLLNLAIGFFTFLWSLLFIIPGIVAAYRYSQAFYVLIDNPEMGVLECISKSKELMRGNKLDLFLLQLSFIGWTFLEVFVTYIITYTVQLPFTIPIVSFWLTPYMGLSMACYYNYLIRYDPTVIEV